MPNQDEWLWLHWTQQEPTNGKVKVECNYCKSASQLRNATKCRTHTIKCSQTPKEVRQLFVSMVNKKTNKNTECHDLDDEEEKSDEEVDSSPVPISWSQSSQPKIATDLKECAITVEDVFEELTEENERLYKDLLFANKCLTILFEFKTFIELNSLEFEMNLQSNKLEEYQELCERVKHVLEERSSKLEDMNDSDNSDEEIDPKFGKTSVNNGFGLTNTSDEASDDSEGRVEYYGTSLERALKKNKILKPEPNDRLLSETGFVTRSDSLVYVNRQRFQTRIVPPPKPRKRNLVTVKRHGCEYPGCGYKTNDLRDLKDHRNKHTGERPHKCTACDKSFAFRSALRGHIRYYHRPTDQTLVCDYCSKGFNSELSFHQHKKLHLAKNFVCSHPECNYRTTSSTYLKRHEERHNDPNEKPFWCDVEGCNKSFRRKDTLEYHRQWHESGAQEFRCTHEGCDKWFERVLSLRKHVREQHTDNTLYCDWPGCEYKATTKKAIKKHMIVHSEERTAACDWPNCNKKFKNKETLRVHMLVHKGDKSHACPWPGCQYRTISGGRLTQHLRSHKNKFSD